MRGVALNLFPTATDDFTFTLYRLPYIEDKRPWAGDEQAVRRYLTTNGRKEPFWTLFHPIQGVEPVTCHSFDNTYATIDAMRMALIQKCSNNLQENDFTVRRGFRETVELILRRHPEGSQVISLEPYLLRSRHKFGFLANFRFRPVREYRGTRRAQQLSLSLDRHGRPNANNYADRYSHLTNYVSRFHKRIFPLDMPGGCTLDVGTQLVEVNVSQLDRKRYVVGSSRESRSQFNGVKDSGPLQSIGDDTQLFFLYKEEDRPLSYDLFRALRGDTFTTFPGMEAMFQFSTSNDRLGGIRITDFTPVEIDRVRDRVIDEADGRRVVPVALTPFSRHDSPQDNAAYWHMKHSFLARNLPLQVVSTQLITDKNALKWAASSIGLQIFAKAGGTPWKVSPRKEKSLIVGIGQAHRRVGREIEKYFAYCVLTDSSGVFEEVKFLAEGTNEHQYIEGFASSLEQVIEQYSSQFTSFVIHAPFTIRRRELESIEAILSERQRLQGLNSADEPGEFVALKFNDSSRFFGFSVDHNSRVPYESTLLPLSRSEYLVWFEGLQYRSRTVHGRIGGPLHVEFTYPFNRDLNFSQKRAHLQDAINLSGANWRGFNAKALPVSILYAQLVARYLREFEGLGLPPVDVNTFTPWFL